MHKNICATFCGKPVESVEKENKGRPTSKTEKLRHALGAVRRTKSMT